MIDENKLIEKLKKTSAFEIITNAEGKNVYQMIEESKVNIEEELKSEVEKLVRKRIKEMQGDYTSKAYIENIINDVVYKKILLEIPDVIEYTQKRIDSVIYLYKESFRELKKSEILNLIVDKLLDEINNY